MNEYSELVRQCKTKGIRVVEVQPSQLCDYAGINPYAAKKMGFTMPKNTIYIDINLDSETKARTLRHEMVEMDLMANGMDYWPAHRQATRAECQNKKRRK